MGTHPPASFDACLYDNGQLKQSTNVAAALWHETVVCLSVVQHMHTSMIQKIQNTETPDIDLYHLLYVINMCIDHEKQSPPCARCTHGYHWSPCLCTSQ